MSNLTNKLDRLAAALIAQDKAQINYWFSHLTQDQREELTAAINGSETDLDLTDAEILCCLLSLDEFGRLVRLAVGKHQGRTDLNTLYALEADFRQGHDWRPADSLEAPDGAKGNTE